MTSPGWTVKGNEDLSNFAALQILLSSLLAWNKWHVNVRSAFPMSMFRGVSSVGEKSVYITDIIFYASSKHSQCLKGKIWLHFHSYSVLNKALPEEFSTTGTTIAWTSTRVCVCVCVTKTMETLRPHPTPSPKISVFENR